MFKLFKTLLITVVVVTLGLPVMAQDAATATSGNVLADCIRLLPADRPIESGADAPSVRLVEPSNAVVYGGAVTVSVQTNRYDISEKTGQHWHLWVNGQLQGMVYQNTAVIDLKPGTYTLCASLGNSQHADIGMPDGIRVTVAEAQAGTPTATVAVDRTTATVQPEGQVSTGQILILVAGALVAGVGGWWLGNRMPKRKK